VHISIYYGMTLYAINYFACVYIILWLNIVCNGVRVYYTVEHTHVTGTRAARCYRSAPSVRPIDVVVVVVVVVAILVVLPSSSTVGNSVPASRGPCDYKAAAVTIRLIICPVPRAIRPSRPVKNIFFL